MKRKGIGVMCILAVAGLLMGCSIAPRKPSVKTVEKTAKRYINSGVSMLDNKVERKDSNADTKFTYNLQDDIGIPFHVFVSNRYFAIVEPIRPFHDNYLTYYTDYKGQVIKANREAVDAIIERLDVIDSKINTDTHVASIELTLKENVKLEDIAQAIIDLDELLALDYSGSDDNSFELETNSSWNGYDPFDVLIQIKSDEVDDNGKQKTLLHATFLFSDNNEHKLTYDDVLQQLQSAYKNEP